MNAGAGGLDVVPPGLIALLLGLVLVAIIHTVGRVRGAVAAAVWCAAALVYGAVRFSEGTPIGFLGIAAEPWAYYVFFGGLLAFNVVVIARRARRLRAPPAARTGPEPSEP